MEIKVLYKGEELFFDKKPSPTEIKDAYLSKIKLNQTEKFIQKLENYDKCELSHIQESIWLSEQIHAGETNNIVAFKIVLNEKIKNEDIIKVIDALSKKQSIFNISIFVSDDGKPYQKIENRPIKIEFLRGEGDCKDFVNIPFKLDDVLYRIRVLDFEKRKELIFVFHHIIFDGLSVGIFCNEFINVYKKIINNEVIEDEKSLEFNYLDYSKWEKSKINFTKEKIYWNKQLDGDIKTLKFFNAKRKKSNPTRLSNYYLETIPIDLSHALKKISEANSSSLFMIMMAAYCCLINRFTNEDNIVIGYPLSKRIPEMDRVCGCFINTIPLKVDFWGNPTFLELLSRVKVALIDSLKHSDIPFSELLHEYKKTHVGSNVTIFNLSIGLLEGAFGDFSNKDIDAYIEEIIPKSIEYDLHLDILISSENEIDLKWQYKEDIYRKDEIVQISKSFNFLLQSITNNLNAPVHTLEMLMPFEMHEIKGLSQGKRVNLEYDSIPERINYIAKKSPDTLAIKDCYKEITFSQLDNYSSALALELKRKNIKKNDIVALLLPRSIDFVLAALAILKLDATYLPIDITQPLHRIESILKNTTLKSILINESTKKHFEFENILNLNQLDFENNQEENHYSVKIDDNSVAYLLYTSGSTGKPKGVMTSQKALADLCQFYEKEFNITAGNKSAQIAGLGFDASVFEIWANLCAGCSLYIPVDEIRKSPSHLKNWLIEEKINYAFVPTALAEVLLEEEWNSNSKLKFLFCGGDKLRKINTMNLPFSVVDLYGLTETAIIATYCKIEDKTKDELPSIGIPRYNANVYILDKNQNLLPLYCIGEIYIGGEILAKNYYQDPELTNEKFAHHPFLNERLMRTGDLGYYDNKGNLHFCGRNDRQIQIRGNRIEIGEIEVVIASYEIIENVYILNEASPNGNLSLHAFIKLDVLSKDLFSEDELKQYLRNRIPNYMIPNNFIIIDHVPITSNGKVDIKKLNVMIEESKNREIISAETETEKLVLTIWEELLNKEVLSIEDDFFRLGGHSLLATQLIHKITENFEVNLSLKDIFEGSTIHAISLKIDAYIRKGKKGWTDIGRISKINRSDYIRTVKEEK